MEQFRTFLGQIGAQRLLLMVAVAAVTVVVLAMLAWRGAGGPMTYLYTDLDPAGVQTITEKLKADGIPFEMGPDGASVRVPESKVAELRMAFAGEQLGGSIGYEILDREDAFGTSAAKARMNRTRAIEGELARSIESLNAVSKARVHIVMPERALFAEEQQPASASVQLRTGGKLATGQVDAIRHLVASAVPGLAPERISVVDQTGALLARAGEGGAAGGAIEERQALVENRLADQIETMLGAIVGPGRVRARVAADLDINQTRQESEVYDPDAQVIARTTTVEREDNNSESNIEGGFVSAANALPENAPAEQGRDTRSASANETSEETVYANSSTKTLVVSSGGEVRRLTVSVMVDGSYAEGPGGVPQYRPRTAAEIDRFTRLVENAIGFDEMRGDSVVVENMRFAAPESDEATALGVPLGFGKDELLPLARTAILGLLGIAALVLVLRAIGKKGGIERALPAVLKPSSNIDAQRMADLVERAANGDEDAMIELRAMRERQGYRPAIEQEIDIAQVEGRLKTSALRKVGEVVNGRPNEATAIVRQWMYS